MKREPGNKKLKILIMSAPIGSGHRMAAVALEEALLRLENEIGRASCRERV